MVVTYTNYFKCLLPALSSIIIFIIILLLYVYLHEDEK